MSDKVVSVGSESYELQLDRQGNTFHAGRLAVEVLEIGSADAWIRADGRQYVVPFAIRGSEVSFSFDGEIYIADVAEKGTRVRARHRDHSMAAPMPGMVLRVLIQVGAVVGKGAPLLVLEAMKMEHTIVASRPGTINAIHCREGEMVQGGVELVEIS